MMIVSASMAVASNTTCSYNISVSPSDGTDNTTICWYNPQHPCSQLSDALDAVNYFTTNVCITVLSDVSLFKPVTLTNVRGIVLKGLVHPQVIVNCNNQSGLSFLGSHDIYVFDLVFDKCLMEHNSTSFIPSNSEQRLRFYCALYFSGCSNVTIIGVDVRYSNATAMTLYDVNGHVSIINSSFHDNQVRNGNGGGGLYIEFTYENPDNYNTTNSTANYNIYNCDFTDNVANVSNLTYTLFIQPINNSHFSFSRGGGISIYLKGNAHHKNISITKCRVIGNHAYWGAGIFAEFQDSSNHNNFIVDSSIICNNINPQLNKNSGTGGGGVRTGYIFYEPNTTNNNLILFRNCQISRNIAYWGGGVSFRTCPEQQVLEASNKLSFINCTLEYNVARLGSAIDLTVWHGLPAGLFSPIIITDCKLLHNSASYTYDSNTLIGKGALFIDTIPVKFTGGKNIFERNSGSAIAVVSAAVQLHTNASISFSHNFGDKGGAIALLGASWITVYENTNLMFYNNVANDKGGAIYVMSIGEHDLISSRSCFIRYFDSTKYLLDWKTNFTFVDNEAIVAGNSVYTTTLLPCIWTASNASSYNLLEATKKLFNDTPFYYLSNKSMNRSEIATAASHFNAGNITELFPGQLKKLAINITDDKGNDASSYTGFLVVTNNNMSALNYTVKNNHIFNQLIRLYGDFNASGNLTLLTTSTTSYHIKVPVSIRLCPPGLCRYIINNTNVCGCNCISSRAYQGVAVCDPDQYQSSIAPLFWAGYVDGKYGDDRYFVTAYCPSGFCSTNTTKKFFNNYKELDTTICLPQKRTGILCGKCISNTSVYSSSIVSICGECKNLHHGKYFGLLQFTLYEILPLILFFLFLVTFNVSLTSGPLNGFIFFSQVISSVAAYNHQFTIRKNSILLFYGIWNLDFLEVILSPYCLMRDWTTLDMFAFHYISAIIPLILILIVIVMMNYGKTICFPLIRLCQNCHLQCPFCFMNSKPIRFLVAFKNKLFNPYSKVLHGLAATLVLSYSKFVYLSFLLLQPSESLHANWPANISDNHLRVLLNGTLIYFGRTHIKYAIPATIIIVLSFLLPLVLLLRPTIHRCYRLERFLRRCLPLTRIDHFLNEFYSCYRPKFQWCASMYFFYRIALFYAYDFTVLTRQYIAQQLLCIAFLAFHSIVQPYNSRLHNCIDGVILAVLLALSCLHGQKFLVSHGIIKDDWPPEYIGVVLACIPLAYLVLYLSSIIVRHCYATYKETYSQDPDNASEEDFNFIEEHDRRYEDIIALHNIPAEESHINHQHHNDDHDGDDDGDYRALNSMVDDVSPSDSPHNSVTPDPDSSKYGTFFDQPVSHVPHTR